MKTFLLLGILGIATLFAAPVDPKKDAARKDAVRAEVKPVTKPAAEVKVAPRTGEAPKSGVKGTDAFGRTQTRYDNGVTAVTTPDPFGGSSTRYSNGVTGSTRTDPFGGSTTRYSNGVTATTRPDPFGGSTTNYSDGTRATTRTDPFGNQVTTYSDGRRETIRPDPFSSAPAKKDGANERK
jgi:gentisate 1,2-dioxygenase